MFPAHNYDFVQWQRGQRKLYESNYLKANSPDGRRGLWLKHNILAPAKARYPAVLELWCVWFDRDRGAPRALEQIIPMEQVAVARSGLRIEAQDVLLTDRETRTTLRQTDGRTASWELRLREPAPVLYHLPYARMYEAPFPKKKILSPAPRVRLDGWLELDGERHEIADWTGLRGHNWGTEHAYAYAYGNCNLFREEEGALLDMYTARLKIGPVKTPWLSQGVLRCGARQYDFNSLRYAVTRDAVVELPRWRVSIGSKSGPLETDWSLDRAQTVGLRYLHPDGQVSYCYNTKFAEVRARFGEVVLTSDQGELEFLYGEPVPGIELVGARALGG